MRSNAIKFNGTDSIIGNEATSIHDFVKKIISENQAEFVLME